MEGSFSEDSSHERSGNGSYSGSSQRSGTTDDELNTIKEQLAKRESELVLRLRVLVILILIAAAAGVSVTVYLIMRNAEKDEFSVQYTGVAGKVIKSFEDIMVEIAAVSGLGVAATSHSVDHSSEWPFVTLSNFQQRAGNARTLSGTLFVSINPIVQSDQLPDWEHFIRGDDIYWMEEGIAYQERLGLNNFSSRADSEGHWLTDDIVDPLHTHGPNGKPILSQSDGPFLPVWQTSPVLQTSVVNENLFEDDDYATISRQCLEQEAAVLGRFVSGPAGSRAHSNVLTSFLATLRSMWEGKETEYLGDPMAYLAMPIFDSFDVAQRKVVAVMTSTIHWRAYFRNILPSSVKGITVVVENSCDGFYTYEIVGDEAIPVGFGDLHDRDFSNYEMTGSIKTDTIADGTTEGVMLNQEGCPYSVHVYPTRDYYDSFLSKDPVSVCLYVALVFVFTIFMFVCYDRLVERRQKLVLAKATQSTAIVASLFPKQVRDRLLAAESDKAKGSAMIAPNHKIKTFLNGNTNVEKESAQPIADLFPHCTVFFADIAGFTAWSSTREPAQVFVLLQAVYQAFDVLAKRRRVFKVETIGDSYVAVTGLPEPQHNHATIMAKFSWECLIKVGGIVKELEVQLGPDTAELHMRFGLHSGPVTAGVLRGERARFQLFGDTVNTASRMESLGMKGMIQVSQTTAEALTKAGKASWLSPREDSIKAKGKGVLKTFWLSLESAHRTESIISSEDNEEPRVLGEVVVAPKLDAKKKRLVSWTVDVLLQQIKKIVVVHDRFGQKAAASDDMVYESPDGKICLDEVKDVIVMPSFNAQVAKATEDSDMVAIPNDVAEELSAYVTLVADSYRDNPFHNFEHACHVMMSVIKLLKRVVAPSLTPEDYGKMKPGSNEVAAHMHDYTHGITSDPMAVFAIVFSALIHDVDHQGISNTQLAKEEPDMGRLYRDKSLAEQNSLDVAWDELMSDQFKHLRQFVFGTRAEMLRFRQLLVNIVLATDIFDKELNDLRRRRWDFAFHDTTDMSERNFNDCRATIVMEHIIQASDVSHTMQHWHVYQQWNKKLFTELHTAFKAGRMGANPGDFWYKGELGFFDNYIIPLAKKLKECNVFGVSSDEYLNYAVLNRAEWEERGEGIVAGLLRELEESSTESSTDISETKIP